MMNLKSQILPLWFLVICSISTVTVIQTESEKRDPNIREGGNKDQNN